MPIRLLTLFLILITFVLIVWGGFVHNSGASLACPDWPLCYGNLMPEMKGGIAIEHGHRLLAGAVALLTLLLAVILRREKESKLNRLGLVALMLVLFQATLGGLTVLYRLPTLVSTGHLALSMIFFAFVIVITSRTGRSPPLSVSASTRRWIVAAGVAVYLQMVLGALVRHSGAGLVCPDLPFCYGRVWPTDLGPNNLLHMAHRYGAIIVTVILGGLTLNLWRQKSPKLRIIGLAAISLVILQILSGIASIMTFLGIPAVTAHLAFAALLWGLIVSAWAGTSSPPLLSGMTDLLTLTKPRLSSLVILTTACGLWLAPGTPNIPLVLATLIGTTLLVGSANALNMYLERDLDGLMSRTRNRPLPSGRLEPQRALWFSLLLAVIAVPLLSIGVNPLTALLGLVAFVFYVFFYTPLKRRSGAALFVGAVPGALPPLMGWSAATGSIGPGGLVLFSILFLWQIPHFLSLSLFYKGDYAAAGLKIMPVERGEMATKYCLIRYLAGLVAVSFYPVWSGMAGAVYLWTALVTGGVFLIWGLYGLSPGAGLGWARSLFFFSILYLPLLLVTLALTGNVS